MPEHPPVLPGERPKPYRDAAGIKWHWWAGQWRKVKTTSQRRAARRAEKLVGQWQRLGENHDGA